MPEEIGNLALSDLMHYATVLCKNMVAAIIVFVIGRFIIKRICSIFAKILKKKNVEISLETFLNNFVSISLNCFLVIIIIGVLGVETSSILTLIASAGVAIGMALGGTLQNFVGGLIIMILKPFKVGDSIEAQGYLGEVKEILIFNTILTTYDNQTIYIPNGLLATGTLKNYSNQEFRRVDVPVSVAYGTDTNEVREVLMKLIDADPRILNNEDFKPSIPMTAMGNSSIDFVIRAWVNSKDFFSVKYDLTEKVYNIFKEKEIEIPFPQMDIHMRN